MKRGPLQVLIALDELLNALLWGDGHHTLSARIGQAQARGKRWAAVMIPLVDGLLGKGHCQAQARLEGLL